MEAPINDSKIVVPFVPSLSHLSFVKVAFPLYKDFDISTWQSINREITHGNLPGFIGDRSENRQVNKAKEELLLIPAHLRLGLLQTILGLHSTFLNWLSENSCFTIIPNIYTVLYWRTDGTIDRIKTAQRLLLCKENNIEQRFDLACAYFFEESIKALWVEMKKSGKADKPLSAYKPVTCFWVKMMHHRHQVPWIESVQKYLDLSDKLPVIPYARYSTFFPLLRPEDRVKFLVSLCDTTTDDFRFCLYGATKEEEMQLLKMVPRKVLIPYLDWPLQSFFLAMAERMWNFIDCRIFKELIDIIFKKKLKEKDFDYGTLFMDFWERGPNHLKKEAAECPIWTRRLNFYLDFIKKEKTGGLRELLESVRGKLTYFGVAPELHLTIQWYYLLHSNKP
ncbi:uncharacterized protein LOC129960191 [Argiope bruennichi]|nr:uncharacterized protein LOC129960191 [Argiope bruennichi]XP_055929385.1 uncharacterized protein LOC129960191 [Argiope bruennichi]XP_055929386.1 uncharacterized protein LOC129960191 [Argiope bruennichi]